MRQNIYDDDAFFAGYKDLRGRPVTFNSAIEQPALRALLPALTGRRVLDLGCGFGDLAGFCADGGAERVTATDISEKMLTAAWERNARPNVDYVQSAMEDLQFEAGAFDIVTSSLALHYIQDYAALVQNVAAWLSPGGVFVFSVEHPLTTARRDVQSWILDDAGQPLYWPVDDYGDEGPRAFEWFVSDVVKYHRTLSTLLNTLTQNGLQICEMREPAASADVESDLPSLLATRRVPPFLLVKSVKG